MIETMLRLSQAHLSGATCMTWLEPGALVAFDLGGGSWLLPLADVSTEDIPADLVECFALARANACDWLLFDHDTPPLSILPVYDGDAGGL